MRDNLKEHVDKNPEEFEIYPFDSAKGWEEIAGKFSTEKKRKNYWPLGVAASLAIIFISSVLVLSNSGAVINEVAEMEGFYQEAINQKIELVKNQLADDQILSELEEMDKAFIELKTDLNENVDNEEVVMAMMENYRLKLKILEEILTELETEK